MRVSRRTPRNETTRLDQALYQAVWLAISHTQVDYKRSAEEQNNLLDTDLQGLEQQEEEQSSVSTIGRGSLYMVFE